MKSNETQNVLLNGYLNAIREFILTCEFVGSKDEHLEMFDVFDYGVSIGCIDYDGTRYTAQCWDIPGMKVYYSKFRDAYDWVNTKRIEAVCEATSTDEFADLLVNATDVLDYFYITDQNIR